MYGCSSGSEGEYTVEKCVSKCLKRKFKMYTIILIFNLGYVNVW